ncbi:hypothetical protein QBC39DRAFT_386331 [Podospora conica]|nr:hypothetical protein QBC39DRAFT_386331 [Schizothecium conicum]
MCRSPPPAAVQAVLRQALPSATVERVQGTPSLRLQRTYDVSLSDGRTVQLLLSPHPALRLLRFERSLLESEAIFLAWIHSTTIPPTTTPTTTPPKKDSPEPPPPKPLPQTLPTLLHTTHGLLSPDLASPATFLLPPPSPTKPTPLSLLTPPPPPPLRRHLATQTGALLRRLASLKSPTGRFGPVAAVVPSDLPPERRGYLGVGGMVGGGGAETWATAFHSLLEGILRDGEDMGVGLPYAAVRRQFRRLGWCLEGVGGARLAVLEGGEGGNVLVEGGEVVGLADWSGCLFGDPLVATVFSAAGEGEEGVVEGFNGGEEGGWDAAVVDDVRGAGTRVLLYRMYHALVSVVREFYRPRVDSSKRELEARKRLTGVLGRLGEVADDPKRSHRRPSGELSPAKRIKGEGEDKQTHDAEEGESKN